MAGLRMGRVCCVRVEVEQGSMRRDWRVSASAPIALLGTAGVAGGIEAGVDCFLPVAWGAVGERMEVLLGDVGENVDTGTEIVYFVARSFFWDILYLD